MNDSENNENRMEYSFEEQLMMAGLKVPSPGVEIKIPVASSILDKAMEHFLSLKGEKYTRLPEYDLIAEWLEDNKGKGLFMFGNCGRGKTMLGRYVLPAIIWKYCGGKKIHCYNIYELDDKLDEILEQHLISLDDIGTETVSVHYGKRRMAFAEIIDATEKEGKLILITSNLDKESLLQRYGERVVDRLVATTIRIPFDGKSLRIS